MAHVFEFIANTADGVIAVDRRQKIVLFNGGATRILGHRAADVFGESCYGVLCGRDDGGCAVCRRGCEAMEAAARLELPQTTELRARTKKGKDVWLSVSTIVVPSKHRDLSVLIHLFREVTEQHELRRAVRGFANVVSKLSTGPSRPVPSEISEPIELTRREREILGLLANGVSTADVASRLSISSRTVRNHITHILGKLGVHSRLEAVTYSIRNGLV